MNADELKRYFVHDLGWGWGKQAQIVYSFLCDAAREAEGGVVLDAGAGHQRYKPFFWKSVYVAQEHPIAGKANKGITQYDILSDVRRIPLLDGSVDLVLSTSSLEHMEFPEEFFHEVIRVLCPGGALYVNVPFVYPEHEPPFDFQRNTRYGLQRYYEQAGFESVEISPTTSSIETVCAFFEHAISEDSRRINQALWARLIEKTVRLWVRSMLIAVVKVYDRGPFPDTTFPIGWIAKGYKKGMKNPSLKYESSADFIARCSQSSGG